jgi:hypothetical protein
MTANDDGGLRPTAVLAAFSESLLSGRRTALLGDSSDEIARRVAAASRRRLHVFDPDRQRVGQAIAHGRGGAEAIAHAPLDSAGELPDGSFDAVLIPELGLFRDAAAALDLAARLLGPRGLLVLASPNGDRSDEPSIGYYELYDLVAERFDHVRMFGEAPFAGYTVGEFAAAGEPPVTIDASLMTSTEDAEWFVVVASRAPVEVDPYVLVQVPTGAASAWRGSAAPADSAPGPVSSPVVSPPPDSGPLRQARSEAEQLSVALEKARAGERSAQGLAAEREASLAKASARLAEVQSHADRQHAQLTRELVAAQKASESSRKRADEREAELARVQAAQEKLEETHQEELDRMLERIAELEDAAEAAATPPTRPTFDVRGFEFQIGELREALTKARAERDEARAGATRAAQLEAELAAASRERDAARAEVARAPRDTEDDEHGREVAALEQRLRERGKVVDRLRADLAESERIGRELVQRLQTAPKPAAASAEPADGDALRAQAESLAQRCARTEADLHAATWKIAALSRELEDRNDAGDQDKLEEALRAAHEELGTLRQKLAERP